MDWYLDGGDTAAVRALRHEVLAHVQRHAERADLAAVELIAGELLANAARHATGPMWVSLEWSGEHPQLTVHDLGPGFDLAEIDADADPLAEQGRGLAIVSHLTPRLSVSAKRSGGSKVTVELPAGRAPEQIIDLDGEGSRDPLPVPEEADERGVFDRESFLRALVVELAQTVEQQHGPPAAEAMVSRVGRDVGGRMEDAYRRVEDIAGPMTPEQLGDLYVRLKHAIEGGFSVLEADEERIVLVNDRCPFGEVVTRAPALCRMTSSVFGGIAARNRGRAAVQLEERIAVGDPGCRVVIWLRDVEGAAARFAHRYAAGGATR